MEHVDLAVIGAGPGGYPAAIRAAQLGARVALVEREALGGTCLNWGCIPTKTLIASADLYHRVRHADRLGLRAASATVDYPAMMRRKNETVSTLQAGVTQLLAANGVKVLAGTASFADPHTLRVARGKRRQSLRADRIIIAAGSVSAMPAFLPRSRRVVDSRAFLDLQGLPESMLVLGGGVIGCELACMAAQLGVRVTVVEMLDDILSAADADLRRVVRDHMQERLSVRVLTGAPLADIRVSGEGVIAAFEGETLRADLLLVSVGRVPVTGDLQLEAAGIETDDRGFVPTDAFCRTSRASVFAVGDMRAGTAQLAHAATSEGVTAAENALGSRPRARETTVPACVFTSPEMATVGLSESQAASAGRAVRVGKYPFATLGKALAAGEPDGFVKWIADAGTDQLLGAQAVGAHATELIAEAAAALRAELTAEELGRTIHCHPTLGEAWMEAAHAVHATCIHAAPRRKRE